MATFKTSDGREYSTVVTMGVIRRTEAAFGHPLPAIALDPKLREKWLGKDTNFAEILYQIVKPQVDDAGLTQEQWEETLNGDATEAAYMAMLQDLQSYAREPLKTVLTKWIAKTEELKAKIIKQAQAAIQDFERVDVASLARSVIQTNPPKGNGDV